VGCFIAKSVWSVNTGLVLVALDDEGEGIDFKFGFAMVSLWRNKHFDPAVLADAG
jgi:hypothetical protein